MNTILPINRCLHPVRIVGQDGINFVPCGKCASCRKSYHSVWRQRLLLEMQRPGITTCFITLTYSNEHLPLVHLAPSDNGFCISDIVVSAFRPGRVAKSFDKDDDGKPKDYKPKFKRISVYDKFKSDYPVDFIGFHTDTFNHYVETRHGDSYTYNTDDCFAICYRPDVQNFIKRLRSCLNYLRVHDSPLRGKNVRFTYFVCSEYGPKTFRPHYHGLLFFRDPDVAKFCNDSLILQCWGKSDITSFSERSNVSSIVNNKSKAAHYVSKYVTCDSPLPSVLNNPMFRPFHLQSSRPAIGSLSLELSDMVDKVYKGDILHHSSFFDEKTHEFVSVNKPYPSSLWSRIFPKFLFERTLSDSTLLFLFQKLFDYRDKPLPDLRERFNERFGIGQLDESTRPFLAFHRIFYDYSSGTPILKHFPSVYRNVHDNCSVRTYSSVFAALYNDSNFADYYLFGIPQNLTACRKILHCASEIGGFCSSPHSYFQLFKRFRSLCDSERIKSQCEYSDYLLHLEHFDYTPAHVKELFPSFYYKLRPTLDSYNDLDYFDFDYIVSLRFGLRLEDFYDDNGNLLTKSRVSDDLYIEFNKSVACHFKAKYSNAVYHADVYEDK